MTDEEKKKVLEASLQSLTNMEQQIILLKRVLKLFLGKEEDDD